MGRAKIKMELIAKEKSRNTTFAKRSKGLKKKIYEFSTLCNVDACMIIWPNQSDRSMRPVTWPENEEDFGRIIGRFLSKSKEERQKHSETLSDMYKLKKAKLEDAIKRLRLVTGEEYPAWDDRLNEYSEDQLKDLSLKIDSTLFRLSERINFMKVQQSESEEKPDGIGMIEYPEQQQYHNSNYLQSMFHGHHDSNIHVNDLIQQQPLSFVDPCDWSMVPNNNPSDQYMLWNGNPTMPPLMSINNNNCIGFSYSPLYGANCGSMGSSSYPGLIKNEVMHDQENIDFTSCGSQPAYCLPLNMQSAPPYMMSYTNMMAGSSSQSQMYQQNFYEPYNLQYDHRI